jgi:hypothetical protein
VEVHHTPTRGSTVLVTSVSVKKDEHWKTRFWFLKYIKQGVEISLVAKVWFMVVYMV